MVWKVVCFVDYIDLITNYIELDNQIDLFY